MPRRFVVTALVLVALVAFATSRAWSRRGGDSAALAPDRTRAASESPVLVVDTATPAHAPRAAAVLPTAAASQGAPGDPEEKGADLARAERSRELAMEVVGWADLAPEAVSVVSRIRRGGRIAGTSAPRGVRRDGRRLLVDFTPEHFGEPPLLLRVELWGGTHASGWIEVPRLGSARDVLLVPVEPVGDLEVEVRVAHDYPLEGVELQVTLTPHPAATTTYGAQTCSATWTPQWFDGGRIKGIPAGSHTLDVRELRSVARSVQFRAVPSAVTRVVVDLDPLPLLGDLSGLISYEAPLANRGGVQVRHVSDPRLSFSIPVGGRWELRGLPAGTYDVVAFPGTSFPVEPPSYRVSEASSSLDFALRNGAPNVPIGFHVVDAATQLPLDGVWLHLVRANGVVRQVSLDHTQRHEALPRNTTVRWRLLREGYEPVDGTFADLDRAERRPLDLGLARQARAAGAILPASAEIDVWVADVAMRRVE